MSRYDDIDHLILDLDNERRYKDTIELENSDLEKTIVELENYLRHLDEVATTGSAEDNEWKTRYEQQKDLDIHLSEYQSWLTAELADIEWKLHTGAFPEAMNCNLDLLTELELVRLVKHMERMKADYYNSVRDTDFRTEREMKDFHHLDDLRRTYKSDLKLATQSFERMKMEDLLERQVACTPPPYPLSPSYVRWLDAQSLDDSILGGKSSKSKSRSKSLSKDRRSSSKSPGRSKSRCDKKSKKKDDTEEEVTGTEQEGATDKGEDDSKGSADASAGDSSKDK